MINWAGIASVILFYILILAVGMWAARKNEGIAGDQEEEVMLAGRNIGMFVGIFTMTATWVGGGYINGTAEIVYKDGLIWCQAPLGYALSLVLGGVLFAHKMRTEGYVTMLDPLQDCFGSRMGGLLFIPALCGEVFWSAGILAALGATLAVIINMDLNAAVIASAFIAVCYTWIGGLYSVAYTDVVQLGCIFAGLVICIPFAWNNEVVSEMTWDSQDWIGEVAEGWGWYYADYMLLLTFGGIPWQVYFQRVLSSKSAASAEILSYIAAFGCIIMAVPPILIGAIAKNTDWESTPYNSTVRDNDVRMILPMVLQHLTPPYVAFFGLGAVSAAVMSSADSSVLSASSMFARNVYKLIFRQHASEGEIMWIMRGAIFVVGAMATCMALTIPTIYGLWAMCSDLVYVILFPQLLIVVHFKEWCNTYGSLAAYVVGMFIRLSGGEKLIHMPALIKYPMYYWDETTQTGEQLFPFRTLAMVSSMFVLLAVSAIFRYLFLVRKISLRWDVFKCFTEALGSGEEMVVLSDGVRRPRSYTGEGMKSGEQVRVRKPDPSLRELQRQISFGTGSTGFGSIRKKAQEAVEAVAHHKAQQQHSSGNPGTISPPPPVAEESSFAERADDENNAEAAAVAEGRYQTAPSSVHHQQQHAGATRQDSSSSRKSLRNIRQRSEELVKDIKEEVVKLLPEGQRGSVASVERPPYQPLEKQTEF